MRVLLLGIYHDPEPIPKTAELARELQKRGHTVNVVTAFPHYPTGKLYPGYRLAPWRREVMQGVPVIRTYIYPYHGKRTILRILNYLTWMISAMQAAWLTPACDVLYVWHPPLTVGVSAWVISKLKRIRFVYDVQDLWPESAIASGLMRPGRLVTLLYSLADWVYARADRILVVSESAQAHLVRRGVDASKVFIARHWVDASGFAGAITRDVRSECGWGNSFVVLFAGNLGMVQGLDTIIEAAARIEVVPTSSSRPDIRFVFVGDGADREHLERLMTERRLKNVQFLGHQPVSEMPAFMRAADALVVHLRRSEIADHAIPTKILSYLAAGRPIVCATGGASADLVRDAQAGLTLEPGDPTALASVVERLSRMSREERSKLGNSGRAFFLEHFDKSRVIDFYERMLLDMTRDQGAGIRGQVVL